MRAILTALVLATPLPAAAVTVTTERRPPIAYHYDRAARELGVGDWTPYFRNETGAHLFVRLSPKDVTLSLWLPPGVIPASRLNREAFTLARSLGWEDADVFVGSYNWGTSIRLERAGAKNAGLLGRRRAAIDLKPVQAWMRPLGCRIGWVAVRCDRGRLLKVEPPAAAFGRSGRQDFAFFRVGSGPPSLRLEYGLSPRWLAAAATALGLWLLFPTAALYTASRFVRRLTRIEPPERLKLFRKWQAATAGATLVGAMAIVLWGGITGAGFLFSARVPSFSFVIGWLTASGLVGVQGRLFGLGIERDSDPKAAGQPWFRRTARELWGAAIGLLLAGLVLWLVTSSGFDRSLTTLVLAGGMGVIVVGVLIAALGGFLFTRRKLFASLAEPSPELLEAYRARTAGVEDAPELRVGAAKTVVEHRKTIVVPQALSEQLRPDQVAALAAAQARIQRRRRSDRLGLALWWLFGAAFAVLSLQTAIALGFGGKPFILGWIAAGVGVPILLLPAARRWEKWQEEADLEMADTFENPRDYLDALKALEELGLPEQIDPVLRDSPYLTQRRTRLHRRLGLD